MNNQYLFCRLRYPYWAELGLGIFKLGRRDTGLVRWSELVQVRIWINDRRGCRPLHSSITCFRYEVNLSLCYIGSIYLLLFISDGECADRRNAILGIIKTHYNIVKTRPSYVNCGNINAIAMGFAHAWPVQRCHRREFKILFISSSVLFFNGSVRYDIIGICANFIDQFRYL